MASGLGGNLRTPGLSQMCRIFLPRKGGVASIPSHFLIVNEWDVSCLPLEGKPWTAVWERCQRARNNALAPVPALLQIAMEQSRDLAGAARRLKTPALTRTDPCQQRGEGREAGTCGSNV